MKTTCNIILLILLLLTPVSLFAQYNPENPSEPNYVYKYRITVRCDRENIAWTSGDGKYASNETVYIHTSSRDGNYTFAYWTMNGEFYSTSPGFDYTVQKENVEFVAYYNYTPTDPNEPNTKLSHKLYFNSMPEGVVSFNHTNGERITVGSWVEIDAYANQGYQFLGWYEGPLFVSQTQHFSYDMPDRDVTLTARFKYNPGNPSEPGSSQGDIMNRAHGDINNDGTIDVTDAVLLLNYYLEGKSDATTLKLCDMNSDGTIDVTDAVMILNKYLEK